MADGAHNRYRAEWMSGCGALGILTTHLCTGYEKDGAALYAPPEVSKEHHKMRAHFSPALRLIHSSPLVVPKYRPTAACVSAVMAWRFTVHHAWLWGRPLSCRCQILPPLQVV